MGPMGRTLLWAVLGIVALILVGMIVIALLKALLKLAVYLIVGGLVVGGIYYLYGKARASSQRRPSG
jgi:O-antigen/teichoic acid export membrane protein